MSDISYEHPLETVVALGDQPFVQNVQTELEHFSQREAARIDATNLLQRLLDFARREEAALAYSPDSRAYGSTRSHLNYIISQTDYLLTNLPR